MRRNVLPRQISTWVMFWLCLYISVSWLPSLHGQGYTDAPTEAPTYVPTETPTEYPTTSAPTGANPTAPTEYPTTATPTEYPTTATPTEYPTTAPPTEYPTPFPTGIPSNAPTYPPDFPTTASPTYAAPTSSPSQCEVEYPAPSDVTYETDTPAPSTYYVSNSRQTMPLSFDESLDIFIRTHPQEYTNYVLTARGYYQQGQGYFKQPEKSNASSLPYLHPVPTSSCYQCYYYPNEYSVYGYDQQGYDSYGYDESGYGRDGYSKYGREQGLQFNQTCHFQNSSYVQYHCIFDNYGRPYASQNGTILYYDQGGYDQYGNDQYGNNKPPSCNSTYPFPLPPQPPTGPTSPLPPDQTDVRCTSKSEELMPDQTIHYIRKASTAMTNEDWQRFRSAWNALNDRGIIAQISDVHARSWGQHNSIKFLPWHRLFIARFEDLLHRIDHCVFLPYWDITASRIFPAGLTFSNFPPPVKRFSSNGEIVLTTVTRSLVGNPPNAGLETAATVVSDFTTMSQRLESFHNAGHVYVGGTMNSVQDATNDPVFYLHHANIDRIWAEWQTRNPNQPTSDVIQAINPLQFGAGDQVNFTSIADLQRLTTGRASGIRFI